MPHEQTCEGADHEDAVLSQGVEGCLGRRDAQLLPVEGCAAGPDGAGAQHLQGAVTTAEGWPRRGLGRSEARLLVLAGQLDSRRLVLRHLHLVAVRARQAAQACKAGLSTHSSLGACAFVGSRPTRGLQVLCRRGVAELTVGVGGLTGCRPRKITSSAAVPLGPEGAAGQLKAAHFQLGPDWQWQAVGLAAAPGWAGCTLSACIRVGTPARSGGPGSWASDLPP